jgi:hypothetical protein
LLSLFWGTKRESAFSALIGVKLSQEKVEADKKKLL